MSEVVPFQMPPRVPPVEPELLSSAAFLFSEYLTQLEAEAVATTGDEDEDAAEAPAPEIDTRAVLDLFSGDLGTSVTITLALFMRVTALYRLLAQSPSLTQLTLDPETGELSETALLAAARLDLSVKRAGKDGTVDYDPRAFRGALVAAGDVPDSDSEE